MQNFNITYEELRVKFNSFAKSNGLTDDINAYLVAIKENSQFDERPYIWHAIVDLVPGVNTQFFSFDIDALHNGINYFFDYKVHQANANLEKQQQAVSNKLLSTLNAVIGSMGGIPQDTRALALQKLILNINPHFFHPSSYEQFQNLRGKVQLEADKYSHQFNAENNELLKLLYKNQDEAMQRVNEIISIQAGLSNFTVAAHADLQALILQLKEQGIEVDEKLINCLAQNKLMQKDLEIIIAYLKENEIAKQKQQQYELKLANYQGLTNACGFISEIGNVVGSRDLVRVGQIAHAGVQIHQAIEQLFNASFMGAAILNPYMAIGMAALKIFSLFQKNDNPQKLMFKQLANISRQIKTLHQQMLQKFGQIDEKLDFIFKKMLEGFNHLDTTLHVYVESKLLQIQSEIETLMKITQIGFQALLTQDLQEQTQYVSDIKQSIITPHLTRTEYETRMGKLARFIADISCSTLFNGLVYEHLLKDNQGSTQQLINIFSQESLILINGLLGLVIKFGKDKLNVPAFNTITPQQLAHPGLWQIAVQTYVSMQEIYQAQFNYDPKGLNITRFKNQGQQLLAVYNLFTNHLPLYQILLAQINLYSNQIEIIIKNKLVVNHHPLQNPRLIFELPEKIKNSSKNINMHTNFFKFDNLCHILAKTKCEIPKIFFDAQALGLGYLEIQVHLPVSVRSRKHHKGEYAISKGGKVGLEITFVIGNQRIHLYMPQLSEKYHHSHLETFYSHILANYTKPIYTQQTLDYVKSNIGNNKIDAARQVALQIAHTLQENSAYHALLKLNHFLIAYLTFGGFSADTIQTIKNHLLLENIADTFASIAQNKSEIIKFPEIKMITSNELTQITSLIATEINQPKNSQLAGFIHNGLLYLDKLEIALKAMSQFNKESSYKPGETQGEFFNLKPNINQDIKQITGNVIVSNFEY